MEAAKEYIDKNLELWKKYNLGEVILGTSPAKSSESWFCLWNYIIPKLVNGKMVFIAEFDFDIISPSSGPMFIAETVQNISDHPQIQHVSFKPNTKTLTFKADPPENFNEIAKQLMQEHQLISWIGWGTLEPHLLAGWLVALKTLEVIPAGESTLPSEIADFPVYPLVSLFKTQNSEKLLNRKILVKSADDKFKSGSIACSIIVEGKKYILTTQHLAKSGDGLIYYEDNDDMEEIATYKYGVLKDNLDIAIAETHKNFRKQNFNGYSEIELDQVVHTSRNRAVQDGHIESLKIVVRVDSEILVDQILIKGHLNRTDTFWNSYSFSRSGDSGTLVINQNQEAVGIILGAIDNSYSVMSGILPVVKYIKKVFNIEEVELI